MKKFCLILLALILPLSVYALPYTGADITLLGTDYSAISISSTTPWYEDGDSIYTNWSGNWVEYTANLNEGNYNIGLNVINRGDIGDGWYTQFLISSALYGSYSQTISIPASDTEEYYGFINRDLLAGEYTIRYTWLNDQYAPTAGLDANIQINSAFFDNTATAPVPEPTTLMLFGSGLLGLAGFRKKFKK